MKRAHMFTLIWLAMAAAMLPAGARPANACERRPTGHQAPSRHESPRPARDSQFPAERSSPSGDPTEKALVPAPVSDVWDGHAARMVTGRPECGRGPVGPDSESRPGPQHKPDSQNLALMIAMQVRAGLCGPGFVDPPGQCDRLDPATGRAWITCHYAHAPPATL